MTWEWSHTQEGYDNVQRNITLLSREDRVEILAEIRATREYAASKGLGIHEVDEHEVSAASLDAAQRGLEHELKEEHPLGGEDFLNESIWEFAQELRRCTNGGHEAHLCPFGCHRHMVSFGDVDEPIVEAILEHLKDNYPDGMKVKDILDTIVAKVNQKLDDNAYRAEDPERS